MATRLNSTALASRTIGKAEWLVIAVIALPFILPLVALMFGGEADQ
jgi:hypothetical protein